MEINFLLFIKLIAAHFLADFCLQPRWMVEKKRTNKQEYHILHAAINAILAYVIVGYWKIWYIPFIIGLSHYLIDLWKSKKEESLRNFIIDQLLHLSVIFVLWIWVTQQACLMWEQIQLLFIDQKFWIYLLGFIIVLKPTSIVLSVSTKKWEEGRGEEGLKDAGKWIGYLERILIIVFVCLSVYEAIGFLLAAKSIFRFGELKDAKEIKKTEYIMIGTFLSFTIAIIDGLLIQYFLKA